MSTKAAPDYNPNAYDQKCLVCNIAFTDRGLRYRLIKPKDCCLGCWGSRHDGYMQIKTMKNALQKLARLACLKEGKEDCTCATCFAAQVIDKLYPEPAPASESSTTVDTNEVQQHHDSISFATPTASETWKRQGFTPTDAGKVHFKNDGCLARGPKVFEEHLAAILAGSSPSVEVHN